ncbi:hypothetical protein ACFL6U_25435 [Planctomycetota bacterium]
MNGVWNGQMPETRLVFIAGSGTCNVPAIEEALNFCQTNIKKGD